MGKKSLWRMVMATMVLCLGLVGCSDDKNDEVALPTPTIVQHEEISDNPLTLAFSWEAVEGASEYIYTLEQVAETGNTVVTTGKTSDLNVELAASKDIELLYSTSYQFSVQASSQAGTSKAATAQITTSEGALALSIESLSYRTGSFKCVPKDKSMMYQIAQIPIEKYTGYDSDMAFIEGYDYGYYKAMAANMPWIPWYGFMKQESETGDYEFSTRILEPNHMYVLYAYGVEFTYNETPDDPVKIITPLIRKTFVTPEWKATSDMTFNVEVVSNKVADGRPEVSVKVTPSSNNERYWVMFAKAANVQAGAEFSAVLGKIQELEIADVISDWSNNSLVYSGVQTVSSSQMLNEHGTDYWNLAAGEKLTVLVCGVDNNGLQTTEIKRVDVEAAK